MVIKKCKLRSIYKKKLLGCRSGNKPQQVEKHHEIN